VDARSADGKGRRAAGKRPDAPAERASGEFEARIRSIIEPALTALGFELVRVRMAGREGGRTLQLMAEPLPETPDAGESAPRRFMTLDDCTAISRAIEPILEVEDPIAGAYALEVSSPGLDRPLSGAAQFARFLGMDAKVEMRGPREGRRRFAGRIDGVDRDWVRLIVDGQRVELNFADMERANLVINDALLKAAQGGRI